MPVEIKPGMVAVIKTTGENVFVLSAVAVVGSDIPDVWVRRPQITQDGVEHQTQTFRADELETLEENMSRQFEEHKLRSKLISNFRTEQNNGEMEAILGPPPSSTPLVQ